jgi:hypothetical protein
MTTHIGDKEGMSISFRGKHKLVLVMLGKFTMVNYEVE